MSTAHDANFQTIVDRISADIFKVLRAYEEQGVPAPIFMVAGYAIISAYGTVLGIDRAAMHKALDSALDAPTSLQTTKGETNT